MWSLEQVVSQYYTALQSVYSRIHVARLSPSSVYYCATFSWGQGRAVIYLRERARKSRLVFARMSICVPLKEPAGLRNYYHNTFHEHGNSDVSVTGYVSHILLTYVAAAYLESGGLSPWQLLSPVQPP